MFVEFRPDGDSRVMIKLGVSTHTFVFNFLKHEVMQGGFFAAIVAQVSLIYLTKKTQNLHSHLMNDFPVFFLLSLIIQTTKVEYVVNVL